MSTAHSIEPNSNEEYSNSREEQLQRYPSTTSSTPNSTGGDKQFQFTSNTNNERSGQNSRTSSVAESTTIPLASINNEGFSNFGEILQHLQTAWFDNNNHDGPRRPANTSTTTSTNPTTLNESVPSQHPKGHSQTMSSSQQHYTYHQSGQQQHNQYSGQPYWNNYNNPRRSGSGNYTRNYSGGNNDPYWNQKSNRFPSHRSMNNLMTNSNNYQQQQSQSSPPTQRRQSEQQQQYYHNDQQQQSSQAYYKKNHDRRPNGYTPQQQQQPPSDNTTSEQSSINPTQSFPSNLNSYNR